MESLAINGTPLPKCSVEVPTAPPGSTIQWRTAAAGETKFLPVRQELGNNLVLTASMSGSQIMAVATAADGTEVARSQVLTVLPAAGNPNTDWLAQAGWGICHHFLSDYVNRVAVSGHEQWRAGESWDDFLATFDAAQYADDVAASGAGFVILTLGQNSGYFLSPNAHYEQFAGVAPGDRCPRDRDLAFEIADALHARGIRFIAYIPANVPNHAHLNDGDFEITRRLGGLPETDVIDQSSMARWHTVIREWSVRFGERLDGWWVDGVFPRLWPEYQNDSPYGWASLASALKAGNPKRIITLNSGIGANVLTGTTEYDDYSPGEMDRIGQVPLSGRWADAEKTVQWFAFTFLGDNDPKWAGWGNNGTNYETSNLVNWVTSATGLGGVVALDVRVNRFGRIVPEHFAQLRAVSDAVTRAQDGAP